MTKKQMLETTLQEYFDAMDDWWFFCHTLADSTDDVAKKASYKQSASMYHREAETIEMLGKKLFGDNINFYDMWLEHCK